MGVCCSENVQVTIAPTPVPITTTQASVTTTRIPVTATWAPITTTVSTTTTVAPITSTAAPVTTTRIPITVLPTTTFAPTPSSLATTQPTVKKGMLYTYEIFFLRTTFTFRMRRTNNPDNENCWWSAGG